MMNMVDNVMPVNVAYITKINVAAAAESLLINIANDPTEIICTINNPSIIYELLKRRFMIDSFPAMRNEIPPVIISASVIQLNTFAMKRV